MDGSALLWPDGPFTGTALWNGLPVGGCVGGSEGCSASSSYHAGFVHAPGERRQAHADHRWAYRRVSDAALAGTLPVELLDVLHQVGVYRKPPIPALMTALAPLTAERGRVFRHRNYVDVAIDLPTGVEEEAVLEAILGQVTGVAELLAGLDTTGVTNDGVPVDDPDGDPSDSSDPDEGGEDEKT